MRPIRARALVATLAAVAAWPAARPHDAGADEEWRPRGAAVVRYDIDARLRKSSGDRDRLRIVGTERIDWRNTSTDAVDSIYLHLYANAFRNTHSSFLREAAADGWDVPDDMEWGGIDLQEIVLASGERLVPEFVSLDDGNTDDRTVVRVELPRPVSAGDSLGLRIKFTTSLPTIVARMGRHNDFVMAAQWYPKLGRYVGRQATNNREGWYCHQFHRNTEFHADFADYQVRLSVPSDVVTGATGTLVDEKLDEEKSVREETWSADGVVDFAWTASPRFHVDTRLIDPDEPTLGRTAADDPVRKEKRRIARLLGVDGATLDLPAVEVRLLIQPEHADQADRHFEAARIALGLYGLWLGPYPYARLTIVDPPSGGRRAGGMEYPMLVTAGTRIGQLPESLRPEGVTVHEVGHQWFMNLLASNEAEEAWLDEGLNTYFTARALHTGYGPAWEVHRTLDHEIPVARFYEFGGLAADWPGAIGLPGWARPPRMETFEAWRDLPWLTGLPARRWIHDPVIVRRRSYVRSAGWDPLALPGWKYLDRASYGGNVYSRTALFIATLRRTLHAEHGAEEGERLFVLALRSYARKWRFRHPTGADFLQEFGAVTGLDTEPLVASLMKSSGVLDYAIESIEGADAPPLLGLVERNGETVEVGADDDVPLTDGAAPPVHRTEIVVRRRGEVVVPVRLRVTLRGDRDDDALDSPDGRTPDTLELSWDGRERYRRFVVDGDVVTAELHPYGEYLQDVDRGNDSRTIKANPRPGVKWAVRFLNWLQNAALSYGRFF